MTINGTVSVPGTVTASGGLTVNSSLANDVLIPAGCTLFGTGTIGGNVTLAGTSFFNAALIEPGKPVNTLGNISFAAGTLTVSGNVTFNNGGYVPTADGHGHLSILSAGGTVSLNGAGIDTSAFFQTPNIVAPPQGLTILQAGSVTGRFVDQNDSPIPDGASFIIPGGSTIHYLPSQVVLRPITNDTLLFAPGPGDALTNGTLTTFSVAVFNSQNQLDKTFKGNITLSLVNPSKTLAHLKGTVTKPVQNGVATFDDLYVTTDGKYQLQASGADTSITSDSFTIRDQLAFLVPPSEAKAGDPQTKDVTVEALDAKGKVDEDYTGVMSLNLFSGPKGATFQLNAGHLVAGVTTFPRNTVVFQKPGTYRLTATGDNALPVKSGPFLIDSAGTLQYFAVVGFGPGGSTDPVLDVRPGDAVLLGQMFAVVGQHWDPTGGPITLLKGNASAGIVYTVPSGNLDPSFDTRHPVDVQVTPDANGDFKAFFSLEDQPNNSGAGSFEATQEGFTAGVPVKTPVIARVAYLGPGGTLSDFRNGRPSFKTGDVLYLSQTSQQSPFQMPLIVGKGGTDLPILTAFHTERPRDWDLEASGDVALQLMSPVPVIGVITLQDLFPDDPTHTVGGLTTSISVQLVNLNGALYYTRLPGVAVDGFLLARSLQSTTGAFPTFIPNAGQLSSFRPGNPAPSLFTVTNFTTSVRDPVIQGRVFFLSSGGRPPGVYPGTSETDVVGLNAESNSLTVTGSAFVNIPVDIIGDLQVGDFLGGSGAVLQVHGSLTALALGSFAEPFSASNIVDSYLNVPAIFVLRDIFIGPPTVSTSLSRRFR